MQIEITEENIEEYGLDELTGNSKEDLLRIAKEAADSGQALYFQVPDRTEAVHNVFDVFPGAVVDSVDESTNPIEDWDGASQRAAEEAGVGTKHSCKLPQDALLYSHWSCSECETTYYAEPSSGGVVWVPLGEVIE